MPFGSKGNHLCFGWSLLLAASFGCCWKPLDCAEFFSSLEIRSPVNRALNVRQIAEQRSLIEIADTDWSTQCLVLIFRAYRASKRARERERDWKTASLPLSRTAGRPSGARRVRDPLKPAAESQIRGRLKCAAKRRKQANRVLLLMNQPARHRQQD